MTYVVESGDTIETIARKYNVSPNINFAKKIPLNHANHVLEWGSF